MVLIFIRNGGHEQNDQASVANLPRAVGSFKNYVDKMRWVGDQKIFFHALGKKCACHGRKVVKKGKILSTYSY